MAPKVSDVRNRRHDLIRLFKVLTKVEYEQAQTPEGERAIKESRARMTQDLRPSFEQLFKDLGGGERGQHAHRCQHKDG